MRSTRAWVRILLVAACAVLAMHSWAWSPLVCNFRLPAVERRTRRALTDQRLLAVTTARENLELLALCRDRCPLNVNVPMLAAANLQILERKEDAARELQRALTIDRRPEIYFNLGALQLELGRANEAIGNLAQAVHFNRFLIEMLEAGPIRDEVAAKAAGR